VASSDLRKEFLELIGTTYENYGYPKYCGWIEGLLLLEQKEWSQKGISDRLGELFSTSTSVPSVNRALKILESYGIVEKEGSRKIGFRYHLQSSSNLALSMFHQFLVLNQKFIARLESLESKNKKTDSELGRALNSELKMTKIWNRAVEQILKSMQDEQGEK
jgi:DNA-binding transcriptional regulator GbsR (MarR family)